MRRDGGRRPTGTLDASLTKARRGGGLSNHLELLGIVRTTKRLERAPYRIALLRTETDDCYANFRATRDLLELSSLIDCAELIVRSALTRQDAAAGCPGSGAAQAFDQRWRSG